MSDSSDYQLGDPNWVESYYPYTPSIGGNSFFMAAFYLCFIIFCYQAYRAKISFVYLLAAFALSEGGGYTARLLMPLENYSASMYNTFLAQLIILIIAPNLVQAYLYAVISKLIFWADIPSTHLIKRCAKIIPAVFVTFDLVCLVVQAIGGAGLADQSATPAEQDSSRTIMMAGLGAQIGCLFIFISVAGWFFASCPAHQQHQIRWVLISLATGMTLIVIRNSYRVAEFSEGSFTDGTLESYEWYYLVADALAMLLTCIVFLVIDVGRWLPADALAAGTRTEAEKSKAVHAEQLEPYRPAGSQELSPVESIA